MMNVYHMALGDKEWSDYLHCRPFVIMDKVQNWNRSAKLLGDKIWAWQFNNMAIRILPPIKIQIILLQTIRAGLWKYARKISAIVQVYTRN